MESIVTDTLQSQDSRTYWLQNLNTLKDTCSETTFFRVLKNLCLEGLEAQNSIKSFLGNLEVPLSNQVYFVQFLYNFSVGNCPHLELAEALLPQVQATKETIKYIVMLLHNITIPYKHKLESLTRKHSRIIKAALSFSKEDQETFEWLFYLLSKTVPQNIRVFFEVLETQELKELIEIIEQNLQKTWENHQSLFESTNTLCLSVADLEFLGSKLPEYPYLVHLLSVVSREAPSNQQVKETLTSSALEQCYNLVQMDLENCQKTSALQLIANTMPENLPAAELAEVHLLPLLKSSAIDPRNPFTREWVTVILKLLIPLKPQLAEKITQLKEKRYKE